MGDRPHVVEKFRVNWPFAIFVPDGPTDNVRATCHNGIKKGETFLTHNDIRKAFILRAALVGGDGCRTKPALINASATQTVSIGIIRVQFDQKSRLEE